MSKISPMWTCPLCGVKFVTRNTWHPCVRLTEADFLAGQGQKNRNSEKGIVDERVDRRLREMARGLKELPPSSARAKRNRED